MPELRKDPILGRWVIISTERRKRPVDFKPSKVEQKGGFCPFCPGNEEKTPPEILAYRVDGSPPNGPGWKIRVVSNKFPALQIEGELGRSGIGLYDMMNGVGAHEVIIETPNHKETLSSLPEKSLEEVFWSYRDRLIDLQKDHRFRYILIFKNHGEAAGASLEHPHSQLIALPIIPKRVQEEIEGAQQYFNYKERCIFCDIVRQEQQSDQRVVMENDQFIVISPFAPRFPFETWILPKRHSSSFEKITVAEFESLAPVFSQTMKRIDRALNDPPYNFVLHNAPFNDQPYDAYHWHFEIMPTLTKMAGFEWGSGFYINPVPPEESTRFLREVDLSSEPT